MTHFQKGDWNFPEIYCIGYTESAHGGPSARDKYGARVIQHVASLTGAAEFDAHTAPLEAVFTQISEELRSMYQIGYFSSNDQPHNGFLPHVDDPMQTARCNRPKQDGVLRPLNAAIIRSHAGGVDCGELCRGRTGSHPFWRGFEHPDR